jgi:hypothetical protein
MKLRSPSDIIRDVVKREAKHQDNIINCERIFVAASVIRWAFQETQDTNEILGYLSQVERYLKEEINLIWSEGTIKVASNIKKGKS